MLKKGHYFAGQEFNEEIVHFLRRHWLSFLGWILILAPLFFVPFVIVPIAYVNLGVEFFTDINRAYIVIGASAYYLFWLSIFLAAWITYYLNAVVITDRRLVVIEQSGLFNRRVSEQSLLRVQDVSAKIVGFLQTFFNYGTVFVETAGEAPNFEIQNIPEPRRIANAILKLHEEMVREASLEPQSALAEGLETFPASVKHGMEDLVPPVSVVGGSKTSLVPDREISGKAEAVKPETVIAVSEPGKITPDPVSNDSIAEDRPPDRRPDEIISSDQKPGDDDTARIPPASSYGQEEFHPKINPVRERTFDLSDTNNQIPDVDFPAGGRQSTPVGNDKEEELEDGTSVKL